MWFAKFTLFSHFIHIIFVFLLHFWARDPDPDPKSHIFVIFLVILFSYYFHIFVYAWPGTPVHSAIFETPADRTRSATATVQKHRWQNTCRNSKWELNFIGVVWDFTLMADDPPPHLCDQPCAHTNLAEDPPPRCVTVRGNIWNSNKNIQIYIHLYAFKYAWMPFLSLVCPISVPQALFCSGKKCSWIFDYVNSGNSPFFSEF
jgi:hypothetical protein